MLTPCGGVCPQLSEALLTNVVVAAGETFVKRNSVNAARSACDALAKDLYSRLFTWIVSEVGERRGRRTQSVSAVCA